MLQFWMSCHNFINETWKWSLFVLFYLSEEPDMNQFCFVQSYFRVQKAFLVLSTAHSHCQCHYALFTSLCLEMHSVKLLRSFVYLYLKMQSVFRNFFWTEASLDSSNQSLANLSLPWVMKLFFELQCCPNGRHLGRLKSQMFRCRKISFVQICCKSLFN